MEPVKVNIATQIAAFLLSVGFGTIFTAWLARISYRNKWLLKTGLDHDNLHVSSGGTSVFVGFLIVCAVVSRMEQPTILGWSPLYFALFGSSFFLLGLFDDVFDLKPIVKLVGQVLLSSVFALTVFSNGDTGSFPFSLWSGALFWTILIVNAFNFIDGIDGLASGTAIVVTATLSAALMTFNGGADSLTLGMMLMAGVFLGFFMNNFFTHKIILGNSGSHLIGFLCAWFGLYGLSSFSQDHSLLYSIVVVSTIFGFPILDLCFVSMSRIFSGKSPLRGDRKHFHYRILDLGIPASKVTLILMAAVSLFSLVGVVSLLDGRETVIGAGFVLVCVAGLLGALWLVKADKLRIEYLYKAIKFDRCTPHHLSSVLNESSREREGSIIIYFNVSHTLSRFMVANFKEVRSFFDWFFKSIEKASGRKNSVYRISESSFIILLRRGEGETKRAESLVNFIKSVQMKLKVIRSERDPVSGVRVIRLNNKSFGQTKSFFKKRGFDMDSFQPAVRVSRAASK